MKTEAETPDPEDVPLTPERAFVRCDTHEFNGVTLKPLVAIRQAAALEMGLRWGNIQESDIVQAGEGIVVYRQLFSDVVKVLWLCSQELPEVRAAIRDSDRALEKAMEWADSVGLSMRSVNYPQACSVFGAIMDDLSASYGKPVFENDSKSKGSSRPN